VEWQLHRGNTVVARSSIVPFGNSGYVIEVDDPDREDVRKLVQVHRDWSLQQTPPDFSFSVEPDAVAEAGITLFTARSSEGELLGVGGLKQLDASHGEVKTMHSAAEARGRGVGRGLLNALLHEARRRGYTRVSLETGTTDAFRPARTLYESAGFRPSPPFADYANTAHNLCMTMRLTNDGLLTG
jgi:putative acetyltransferase